MVPYFFIAAVSLGAAEIGVSVASLVIRLVGMAQPKWVIVVEVVGTSIGAGVAAGWLSQPTLMRTAMLITNEIEDGVRRIRSQ